MVFLTYTVAARPLQKEQAPGNDSEVLELAKFGATVESLESLLIKWAEWTTTNDISISTIPQRIGQNGRRGKNNWRVQDRRNICTYMQPEISACNAPRRAFTTALHSRGNHGRKYLDKQLLGAKWPEMSNAPSVEDDLNAYYAGRSCHWRKSSSSLAYGTSTGWGTSSPV